MSTHSPCALLMNVFRHQGVAIKKEDCNIFADDVPFPLSFFLLSIDWFTWLWNRSLRSWNHYSWQLINHPRDVFYRLFPFLVTTSKNKYEAAKNRLLSGSKYHNWRCLFFRTINSSTVPWLRTGSWKKNVCRILIVLGREKGVKARIVSLLSVLSLKTNRRALWS